MGRKSKYTAEFRREAVELFRSSRAPAAEVARSLNMSAQTLGNWIRADRRAGEGDEDVDGSGDGELKRLRAETAQLRIDNEILSKAAAYFARETNQ